MCLHPWLRSILHHFFQDQIQPDICYFSMVVTINNSMHWDWQIWFLSTDQTHNKALWTSFLFKHGSWCVSFTCLSFSSCKMTSQTVEEKTLTNKLSLVPFLFLYFPFLLLSWCHKFLLLLMSLMPQIKGTFIKMECFKTKPCPSQKKMTRVHGSNIT